jgi:CRP/FNR family transcriptional regulator, anaerobic regulatory protein
MRQVIHENFSYLFEEKVLQEIEETGIYKEVNAGETLIEIGSYVNYMPLLISGAVKIFRQDEEGDEYILYFLERGDTCAMTLNCCLGQSKSEIKAVAEVDTTLILVPVEKMEEWLQYKSWRSFVFESYNNRLTEMLEAIDSLAFMNLDSRLLKYLKDKVLINKTEMLEITHQEIASELNTSRVVISRILKKFEQEKKIVLHRNKLEVLDF